ncbi:hypothetical protein EP7_004327 [Isosphaeraceae bacterium EP7]
MAKSKPKAKPTPADIKKRVVNIAQARTDALSSIESEIERLYSSYFDRVRSVIASDKELRRTDVLTLQNATATMADLENILIDAGMGSVVAKFGEHFPELAEVAATYFEPFGVDNALAGVSKQTLSAWVDFSATELTKLFDGELIAPVRSALLQVNFGNMTRDALIDQITTLQPGISTNNAVVAVDDAFSQFQRAVVVAAGDAAELEIYQYLGPDDGITSDQCSAMLHVSKHGAPGILYKDEITSQLHPNLERYGRNPLIGGGHPRCRHQWSPIPEDYAVEQFGFKPR